MKTIGYQELVARFGLKVLPPASGSFLLESGRRRSVFAGGCHQEYYPPRDNPGSAWTDHLQFALKHEGVNLEILAALFKFVPADDLNTWIASTPTGRYARIAWFLYEWFTGLRLPLPDLDRGSYLPVLDNDLYYALPIRGTEYHVRRQRVIANLPGTPAYCPLVRRTEELRQYEEMHLDVRAEELVQRFPSDLLYRAAQFLYLKETKSSYAIEHLTADQRRTSRFVTLLRQAGTLDCYSEAGLVKLQNAIVDERYAERGFRSSQNYIGQSLGPTREIVHFVPPKPDDLKYLMEGWSDCCKRMQTSGVHTVVSAAVSSFGFVFLHPFEDGNGRLHRFLLHHALVAGAFVPVGVIFPVSATMLRQMGRYDETLENYSRPIGEVVDYTLDNEGRMHVDNETASFYRYPDFTQQTEALFGFIKDTINTEMATELEYLALFDSSRELIREIVDMPDRRLELYIRLCLQGKGHLSKSKRGLFAELTDNECRQMEDAVRSAMDESSHKSGEVAP
jgi:hypothetical protein